MMGRVVAIALIGALVGLLLRECGLRGGGVISVLTGVMLLILAVSSLGEILSLATELSAAATLGEAGEVALKLLGIGYLFGFAEDTCQALGEGYLARIVALCGRIESAIIVIPYFKRILAVALALLE